MKNDEPEEWNRAVQFEKDLQLAASNQEALKGVPFLHDAMKTLDQIDFDALNQTTHKQVNMFGNECEGMCGV
jgi:hypothetical protein